MNREEFLLYNATKLCRKPGSLCCRAQLHADRGGCLIAGPIQNIHAMGLIAEEGLDCWLGCGKRQGKCTDFCGANGACCKLGFHDSPPECGSGTRGCDGRHCCVLASQELLNEGANCWERCRGQEDGVCSSVCGAGGACCRAGFHDSPFECNHGSLVRRHVTPTRCGPAASRMEPCDAPGCRPKPSAINHHPTTPP